MKKLIAAAAAAAVLLSSFTGFALEKINYDFDGTAVGSWGGIGNCDVVEYPDASNHCLQIPTGSTSQITNTPGIANSYLGETVFSGDFYPTSTNLNVNIFLRYFNLNSAANVGSSFTYSPKGITVDASGNIKVADNSVTVGKCEAGEKYSFKIVNDTVNHKCDYYINGKINGTVQPAEGEDSEKFPGFKHVGTLEYAETVGPVGAVYVYNNKPAMYVDNLKLDATDLEYTVTDFNEGDSEITFEMNHFIDTSTIQKLKLSRLGADGNVTGLVQGADYTVSWAKEMTNFTRAAVPTITLAEAVGNNEQIIFDFTAVDDTYGRSVGINTALPKNPDSDAINAALAELEMNWLTQTEIKSMTVSAPSEMTPIDGGSTVSLSYEITADEETSKLIKYENDEIAFTQPEVDDILSDPASFDKTAEITVTLSCGSQPNKTLTRNVRIVRRKLLDEVTEGGGEITAALSDDDEETAWELENGSGELVLGFGEPKAIGGIIAKGEYTELSYSVSEDGSTYSEIMQYPVKAKYLKINASGTKITSLEPVTSAFYEDVIYRADDLSTLTLTQKLTGLTSTDYLTLPKATENGTPVSWSSSDRNVIDEYGTVTQGTEAKTVILTAKAIDSKNNVIEIAEKSFTAEVAAAAATPKPGGNGGGGGGGSSSGVSSFTAPVVPTPTPLPTPAPSEKKGFSDMENTKWAEEAVNALVEKGIINGKTETEFAPNDNIRREEFVKLIVTAFGLDKSAEIGFEDVPDNAWYTEYVKTAYGAGVVSGISENEFGVGLNVSRQDMAVMLKRAADLKGLKAYEGPLPVIEDFEETADYARSAVLELLRGGVLTGSDGRLNPAKSATRAEAAVMMYRFINAYK